ncbi:hypothetical protein BH10PSE14_BH10PSE14_31580 [soil metagenome]
MTRKIICALLLAVAAQPLPAATSGWTMTRGAGDTVAIGQAARGSWSVRVRCTGGRQIDMIFVLKPLLGWNANGTVVLRVDGVSTPVISEGIGEYGLMVHETDKFEGISRAFLARLRSAKSLVLEGTAARSPVERRTFPLIGAAASLRAVSEDCAARR